MNKRERALRQLAFDEGRQLAKCVGNNAHGRMKHASGSTVVVSASPWRANLPFAVAICGASCAIACSSSTLARVTLQGLVTIMSNYVWSNAAVRQQRLRDRQLAGKICLTIEVVELDLVNMLADMGLVGDNPDRAELAALVSDWIALEVTRYRQQKDTMAE